MTTAVLVLYVYGLPENVRYSLLRASRWSEMKAWLVTSDVPVTWTPRLHGWCIRTERIGDLIAQAEVAGFVVRMKGALR